MISASPRRFLGDEKSQHRVECWQKYPSVYDPPFLSIASSADAIPPFSSKYRMVSVTGAAVR